MSSKAVTLNECLLQMPKPPVRLWSYWISRSDPVLLIQVIKILDKAVGVRCRQVYGWKVYPYNTYNPQLLPLYYEPVLKKDIELTLFNRLT